MARQPTTHGALAKGFDTPETAVQNKVEREKLDSRMLIAMKKLWETERNKAVRVVRIDKMASPEKLALREIRMSSSRRTSVRSMR